MADVNGAVWRLSWAVPAVLVTGVALGFSVPGRTGTARGPAWVSNPKVTQASVRVEEGIPHVTAPDAPFLIRLDSVAPDRKAELLWYEGVSTHPVSGGTVVLDSTGTLLRFSDRLRPSWIPSASGTRVFTSVTAGPEGSLWVTDADGMLLRVEPGGATSVLGHGPYAHSSLASDRSGESVWVTRASDRFEFLLEVIPSIVTGLGPDGRPLLQRGGARVPEHILLAELANAGHIAVSGDTVFYAPFIRDEVTAFGPRGNILWVLSRALPQGTDEPRFELDEGRAVIDYHPVNLGLRVGPDGLLYVLSTAGFTMATTRLDAIDPATGNLIRSVELETALPTLAADDAGRVYALDPVRLLAGTAPADRPLAPDVRLPLITGGDGGFSDYQGKVLLVNVWASWCAPCREEMPALDSLRQHLAGEDFAFITIDEDHVVEDARAFLDDFGFSFPVLLGRGAMRTKLHYPGLPFTLLLDREGKVVRRWIGFAGPQQVGLIETVIRHEIARSAPAPESTMASHQHAH